MIYATFADAVDQFKDGHVDAAWNVLDVPAAAIVDVSTTKPIRFLEITGPKLDELIKQLPLLAPYTIPGGSYKGIDKDVQTVSLQAALYARSDLDEQTVYDLTKTMYEKNADIAKGHQMGKQISLKTALQLLQTQLWPAGPASAEKPIPGRIEPLIQPAVLRSKVVAANYLDVVSITYGGFRGFSPYTAASASLGICPDPGLPAVPVPAGGPQK